MLGKKIKFNDQAAWDKARLELDISKEYISDSNIERNAKGQITGGYYEICEIDKKTTNNKLQISILQSYLKSTDWYILRQIETGALIPVDVSNKRLSAREEISELNEKG